MSSFPSRQPPFAAPPNSSRTKTYFLVAAIVAGMALVLSTCGRGFYHNYNLSAAAVDRFHAELDQGDYDSIWENGTDDFRKISSRENISRFFQSAHQKLGNSGKKISVGFHVNWQARGVWVSQVFDTQFAQAKARESFIWVIVNDEAKLQSYNVNPLNSQ